MNCQRKYSVVFQVGLFIGLCLLFYRYTVDDAYISMRFARNFANGHGLVFSTDGSPPVEGYTNFLWVVILTPLYLLDLSDLHIINFIKGLGIVFGVGIVWLTSRLTAQITNNNQSINISGWLVAAVPYLAFWSIGGLETSLYIFLLLAGTVTYFYECKNQSPNYLSALCLVLASLTRPEGLLFAVVLVSWHLIRAAYGRNWYTFTQALPGITLFAVIYSGYFYWRFNYYGYLLPNTFYARSGGATLEQLISRSQEIAPFILYFLPIITLVVWWGVRKQGIGINAITILLLTITLLGFSFASRREWMPGYRYEIPMVPFAIALASSGLASVETRRWLISAFLFVLLLIPAISLYSETDYTDELERAHIPLGLWLKNSAPPDCSFAGWDMGAIPYYSELPLIIDIHPEGILSTYITHVGYDVEYFLSLKPCYIVLPPKPEEINSSAGMYGFYLNDIFQENYEFLTEYRANDSYMLSVFQHKTVESRSENANHPY